MKAKFKIGMLVKSTSGGFGEVDAVITRATSFSYSVSDGGGSFTNIDESDVVAAYVPVATRSPAKKTKSAKTVKRKTRAEDASTEALPV